jgi:hypothetical protein
MVFESPDHFDYFIGRESGVVAIESQPNIINIAVAEN